MDAQANRVRFPEVAEFVDRCRQVFGSVSVSYVRDLSTGEVVGRYPSERSLPACDQAVLDGIYVEISSLLDMLELKAVGRRVRVLRSHAASIEARTQNGMRIVEVYPLRRNESSAARCCWWCERGGESDSRLASDSTSNTVRLSRGRYS